MTVNEQLLQWVKGNSVHNEERNECVPDFSCCNPAINTPIETRELFMEAYLNDDEEQRQRMLMTFLGQSLATVSDKKVHITG